MKDRNKKEDKIYLYGKHALNEALTSKPEVISKVFLSENAADKDLLAQLNKLNIAVNPMKSGDADKRVGSEATHQGVIALVNIGKIYKNLDEILKTFEVKKNPCFVILDELQDPHNVGSIIRTAAAFGVDAIFIPEHNQSPITGTVIKTSAGMVFKIPICKIGNVNQLIRLLKEKNFWIYGLVMEGDTILKNAVFDTPTAFVVGNESVGIREKSLDLCDVKLSVPMQEKCESLNASVATSIVLYEWSRNKKCL